MLHSYDITTNPSTCHNEVDYYRSNEPTYVNETQLLFFNNDIINIYQRPEFHYNNDNHDQTMRYIISRSDDQWHRFRAKRESEAAITIQRAYRLFRLRRKTKQLRSDQDEACNYIQFWDECEANRRGGCWFKATSDSVSDSKNSDGDDHDDKQHRKDHIYDSIPCELSYPTPPDSPSMRQLICESQRYNRQHYHQQKHHSQCPLSKQRKHSVDLNRLAQSGMFVHRHSDQHSPHSVIIYEEDLRKINPNLYVLHSCEQQPLVMTINSNCPTHKVYHQSNTRLRPHSPPKIDTLQSHSQPYIDGNLLRSSDDSHQLNLLRKQSRIVYDQKLATDKRMYRIGLNIFNKNPSAGINYLLKYQYIKAHPSDIAKFLLTKSGISRNAIGDYMGSISDPLALQVTKFFLRRINMKNKEVDEALRSFIYYVHLPGESQKISHLMEEFKVAYLLQNESRSQFKSTDTIMVLAYAIIMLQTDAHNQSIRKSEKMTLEQFINNLRGLDENSDIERRKLEHIYARVTGKEIKTQPDHTDQVRRLNDVICGSNKPSDLVNRIRRFMCYCRLSEIIDDGKKNKTDAHQREVFLFNDILLISKLHNKSKKDDVQYQCKYAMALANLRVKLFSSSNHQFGVHLFDSKTNESLLKLNARCEQDQKKFMFDLSDCILESLEMLTINYSEYLSSSPSRTDNSPKTSRSLLLSNNPSSLAQNISHPIPNTPRRQESLVKMDRPDVIRSLHRVRRESLTDNDINCLKTYI